MMNNAILNMKVLLEDAAEKLGSYHPENLYWYSFPQLWGSTALGFGGIGGACMTTAQTVVVMTHDGVGKAAVYFGGRFAYLIANPGQGFSQALDKRRMPKVKDAYTLERGED
jgi:hypothetical protein